MISFNLLFFADDTTIYKSDYGIVNLATTVRQELSKIYNWLSGNKLCLNVKKTQYCDFSPTNINYEAKSSVKINNDILIQIGKFNRYESVTFLGIHYRQPFNMEITH